MNGGQLVVFAVIGAVVGFFCGMIPFKAAMSRNQSGLAIGAMVTCVLMGLLGGCFLALPTAFVFKWIALSIGVVEEQMPVSHTAGGSSAEFGRKRRRYETEPAAAGLPYTILGTAVVCNRCSQASSKLEGRAPSECPGCGYRFAGEGEAKPVPRVYPKAKRAAEPAEDALVPLERA